MLNYIRRFQWIKYCIALVLIIIIFFFAVQIYINSYSEKFIVNADTAPVSDAVIVLGALVYNNGQPSPVLQDRLDYALELYNKGKAGKILVSGDHGTKEYDEVNAMKDYLLKKGVPREDIFMDHAGFDTYDSIYRAKHIFEVNTLLISTQRFHINRSLYIARKLGIEAYGYPSPDKDIYNMKTLNIRESLAKIKAFFDTDIFKTKPKFEGDTIPIWSDGIKTEG